MAPADAPDALRRSVASIPRVVPLRAQRLGSMRLRPLLAVAGLAAVLVLGVVGVAALSGRGLGGIVGTGEPTATPVPTTGIEYQILPVSASRRSAPSMLPWTAVSTLGPPAWGRARRTESPGTRRPSRPSRVKVSSPLRRVPRAWWPPARSRDTCPAWRRSGPRTTAGRGRTSRAVRSGSSLPERGRARRSGPSRATGPACSPPASRRMAGRSNTGSRPTARPGRRSR